MGEYLIKPYEISVWEDELTQNGFREKKIAVIGSNTMTGLNKIYDPVFTKKNNGEKSLSFSLRYKYFDPYSENEDVINPFSALLINERKVKLHYEDEWYDFIIKEHTESSDGLVWTYSCVDAFVLELSKTGYNIEFSTDLNNNQGTAIELATETLKNTDWEVAEDSNIGKQQIDEAIYSGTLGNNLSNIQIINADTGASVTLNAGARVYVFYSYVANKDGKFVQFVLQDTNDPPVYIIDDNNTIIATNYRITTELVYDEAANAFKYNGTIIIQLGNLETQYHAYRLAYNQLTTYDPVMGRTVKRYKLKNNNGQEIYSYTDSVQVSSGVLTNFITNGDNFNIYENGTLQGWDNEIKTHSGTWTDLTLVTKPPISSTDSLVDINFLNQIEGYLKADFHRWGDVQDTTHTYDCIFNSGIEDNASILHHIAVNDKFVFRYRARFTDTQGNADSSGAHLRLFVAKYTANETWNDHTVKNIDTGNIILSTNVLANDELNNVITNGVFSNDFKHYYIDNVEQTPTTKYIYKSTNTGNTEYVWDVDHQPTPQFVTRTNNNYIPYRYAIATARRAVSNSELTDPKTRFGIFIYYWSSGSDTDPRVCYIQDIQLTRYIEGSDGKPLTIGNIPDASAQEVEYFYEKPKEGQIAEETTLYTDYANEVIPIYNENSVKNLSISAAQSNCFNILQTIAETFECWIELEVQHDDDGSIKIIEGKPQKYVHLKEYIGHDNWAGFRYGVNLNTIERTINSDEIVTKLIVDNAQSTYTDTGSVAISYAKDNPSGENYIFNFDYFSKHGLIQGNIREEIDALNNQLKEINNTLNDKEKQRIELETAINDVNSNRNVFTQLLHEASNKQNDALDRFEELTHQTYAQYQAVHTTIDTNQKLTEEDTLLDVIGEIYTYSAVKNSYGGILTNLDEEYKELKRKLKGNETYYISLSVLVDTNYGRHVVVSVSDYDAPFKFTLDNNEYNIDVSNKYFSIASNASTITFTCTANDYRGSWSNNTVQINDNAILKFELKPTGTIIPSIESEIDELIENKQELINNFEKKYRRFIQEGTWSATDYISSDLYYLDALQVSNTSAQPVVSYSINVVEISEIAGFEYYKFNVGDKTYVEDTEFFGWANKNGVLTPAREEVIVSEIEWHLDDPANNIITVQNYKTRFEDLFQRISATVQTVQYNEATYAKISTLLDANGTINQDVLLASMNRVAGQERALTTDGSIQIHGDEILIHNLKNASNYVMINNEGIKISSDGGNTWSAAITGRGIDIGNVYTGMLNTDTVIIGNRENPSFRWDQSGISAYRLREVTRAASEQPYDLQTFVRFDQYGLYGIKNNGAFKAQNLQDVKDKAHFAVTWDGFFIRNSYTNGWVEITSDNDFRVMQRIRNDDDQDVDHERIKIGALEFDQSGNPTKYGININQTVYNQSTGEYEDIPAFTTGDDGNITITGTINATGGNFSGIVNVGPTNQNHIVIDGIDASIYSSNYQDGAGYGWLINKDGDAYFNNITARGAIKTAVFEYAEIQAVGGIFIFRPSSTIRSVEIAPNETDLIFTVEKPYLFQVGSWCKVSNYTTDGSEPNVTNILLTNGLTHTYEVIAAEGRVVTLADAAVMVQGNDAITTLKEMEGGALIDMGREDGTSNYGIGINSSDNTVNLPRRAISLFETVVNENSNPKISYKYRGILGTLPILQYTGQNPQVSQLYHNYLEGTQGIYTDNMYIGDNSKYIAFYTDNNTKKLRIAGADIVFTYEDGHGGISEKTLDEKIEEIETGIGEDAIHVEIDSSAGNIFINNVISTILRCYVYKGGMDITHDNNYIKTYTWKKINIIDGSEVQGWTPTAVALEPNAIRIAANDVDSKAVFQCMVSIEEA